jgi:hypothetical protein
VAKSEQPIRPDLVEKTLQGALRAPSAHNAQPWRLSPIKGNTYLLWYAYADKLRADPDDRDGLMAVGGFFDTLRLSAHGNGVDAQIDLAPKDGRAGISIGTVVLRTLDTAPDPLAGTISVRQCNRARYDRRPLPRGLASELVDLGNLLLPPGDVAGLVRRASILSWRDPRFVSDLEEWTRFDDRSPDGMTFDCLRVRGLDPFWLRLALRLGRLPGWLAWAYAERDVRLTHASGAIAVLTAPGRSIPELFECGRRLIRSWTLINALGYSWHPMSVVIDQSTVKELRTMLPGHDPIAIYRVGATTESAAWSKRRSLDAVLVPSPF